MNPFKKIKEKTEKSIDQNPLQLDQKKMPSIIVRLLIFILFNGFYYWGVQSYNDFLTSYSFFILIKNVIPLTIGMILFIPIFKK